MQQENQVHPVNEYDQIEREAERLIFLSFPQKKRYQPCPPLYFIMPLGLKVSSTFAAGTKEAIRFSMPRLPGVWSDARNAAVREPFEEKAPNIDGFVWFPLADAPHFCV
jgi:hypothetical protein